MTRSAGHLNLIPPDPEIERTLHALNRLNRANSVHLGDIDSNPISDSNSDSDSDYFHNLFNSDSELENHNMAEQTLRQLAAPDVNYNGLCIEYVDVAVPFELKSGLIHLLPRFSSLAGEDPHKHLKEFQVVCSTPLRPEEKYFPASRAASIRKEICGIRQSNESLAEYWERFKQLVSSCPQHQITEQLLIQYFYEGLQPMDRNILDAAGGGALVDKTPVAAKTLIENMSLNSQQFSTRNNALAVNKPQTAKVCDICTSPEHPTDTCPILQDDTITELPQAYAATAAPYNQYRYNNPDLSTNRYHPSWRNHPNLRYGNQSQVAAPSAPPATPSLEDLVKQLVVSNTQYQQRTDASIQSLTTQMGQMANAIGQLQVQGSGNLPAQTVPNPNVNSNVSAITLRSGRVSEPAPEKKKKKIIASSSTPDIEPSAPTEAEKEKVYVPPIPFPQRVQKNKKKTVEEDKEILETFRKVAVNIPLLDAIKQIPKYAKFLKDLCTNKRKVKENDRVLVWAETFLLSFIQIPVLQLMSPLSIRPCHKSARIREFFLFLVPLGIENSKIACLIWEQPTGLIVQLANRSNARPAGVLEDVLVQTCPEFFYADFPSLSDFDDIYSCDSCTNTNLCSVCAEIESTLQNNNFHTGEGEVVNAAVCTVEVLDIPAVPTKPSIEQPPSLELKPLPENLKYAYLEENEMLPVIISSNLDCEQEEKLLQVLKQHKKAIGWTLADIPGISPAMCMHRILLEEGAKVVRQPQRRLSPLILDVVKKEVTKLLQAGIIYPISDSSWVSPVQVVPKKSGLTVVKNEKNELVPTRFQNSWRVCIDYRRLNQATRKDHFPLPFIDQMLERLAVKSHYCFLDGGSGGCPLVFAMHLAHSSDA
ncbi:hypothetical protein TSUD_139370 [Trifolium subterraneum]|uniref:Retrotransposon gag domain-containing protein n=1 Tax=Trifolium subterraneum TaxID=3900 RepID=A0A2Z6NIG2_TRISU|nr:hypothetical protein TSUD_139370 [Trifolium subterraneum]